MIALAMILLAAYNPLQTLAVMVFGAGGGMLYWAGKQLRYRDSMPTVAEPVPEPFSVKKVVGAVGMGLTLIVAGALLFAMSQGQL